MENAVRDAENAREAAATTAAGYVLLMASIITRGGEVPPVLVAQAALALARWEDAEERARELRRAHGGWSR